MRHCYVGVENLNLDASQRTALIDALKALGPSSDPQPARINHWRMRLDNEATIFEALFDTDDISIQAFKDLLASIFGVDPSTISDSTQQTAYGPLVMFSHGGTDYLRFLLFGGPGATWQESGDGCRTYLIANAVEWEPST